MSNSNLVTVEFKVKVAGVAWEKTPVTDSRVYDADDAVQAANAHATTLSGLAESEVRWNYAGSLQGHYVASPAAWMKRMHNDAEQAEQAEARRQQAEAARAAAVARWEAGAADALADAFRDDDATIEARAADFGRAVQALAEQPALTVITKSSQIKKGMRVRMRDGYECTVMDNQRGNIRSVKGQSLFGQGDDWGSALVSEMAEVEVEPGRWVRVRLVMNKKQAQAAMWARMFNS